jgi:hypothetical protein
MVALIAIGTLRGVDARQAVPSFAAGGCSLTFPSPLHIPVTGTIVDVVIDEGCDYVYLTNRTFNRVEVFSLATLSLLPPIQVGAQPVGLDLTPDGSLLYVANSGGENISVIDVAQRVELRRLAVPRATSGLDRPFSIAIANNGRALFSTTFDGSGFGARLMELLLPTEQFALRSDFHSFGSTTENTRLRASGDRGAIGVTVGSDVYRYSAGTNTFSLPRALGFLRGASLDMNGSTLLVAPASSIVANAWVLDAALNISGTILLSSGAGGTAVDPAWGIGYRSVASRLDTLNVVTFLKTGELPLGDTVTPGFTPSFFGLMDISGDGSLLAVITDHGFSLVRPWPVAPPALNLVRNGTFASGLTRWIKFATPTPGHIDGTVNGGVFEFYRLPAPPGTPNQAVVYQETGMALPAGAPVQADFDLGNSSSVRKRISVLVLDGDFSDLHVCTFWLPPSLPLTTFRMRTHTTRPWVNASIYFYASTPGFDGGFYRLDNVSVRSEPALPDDRTECVDPLAPDPPGGPDEMDLLVNGDFGTGTLAPWTTFGTITSQIASGTFEFIRPASTPPAGVVFQATGQAMSANQILTATFALGNSSAVRKRVTAILHDADFSDLAACTFWLEAGQLLSPYSLRTYATQPWANATISFYAATVGSDQWIQLDDVTLRRTPAAAIAGTECLEPVTPMATPAWLVGLAMQAARKDRQGSRTRAPEAADVMAIAIADGLTITPAPGARLAFESWLTAPAMSGEVQISADGERWITFALVPESDDWQRVDVDLSAWQGRTIHVRLVIASRSGPAPVWRVRDLVLLIGHEGSRRSP